MGSGLPMAGNAVDGVAVRGVASAVPLRGHDPAEALRQWHRAQAGERDRMQALVCLGLALPQNDSPTFLRQNWVSHVEH